MKRTGIALAMLASSVGGAALVLLATPNPPVVRTADAMPGSTITSTTTSIDSYATTSTSSYSTTVLVPGITKQQLVVQHQGQTFTQQHTEAGLSVEKLVVVTTTKQAAPSVIPAGSTEKSIPTTTTTHEGPIVITWPSDNSPTT